MCLFYSHTNFQVPNCNSCYVIVTQPKAKYRFHTATQLFSSLSILRFIFILLFYLFLGLSNSRSLRSKGRGSPLNSIGGGVDSHSSGKEYHIITVVGSQTNYISVQSSYDRKTMVGHGHNKDWAARPLSISIQEAANSTHLRT
jgi:hypothetical protein